MTLAGAALGFGIVAAAVLALSAVAMTLQFGITNIFNIAIGSQMTLAMFIAYEFNRLGLDVWLAMAASAVFTAMSSVLLNRGVYESFLRRGTTYFGVFIIGMSVLLIVQFSCEAIWGPGNRSLSFGNGPTFVLSGAVFTTTQVIIVGLSVVAMLGVHGLLRYTKFGTAMRAAASDQGLAASCGVRTRVVSDVTWALSGGLCGAGAVALAMSLTTFSSTTGSLFLLEIIAAAVLGGIGQPYGAMLGALIIGVAVEESSLVISSAYTQLAAFIILILVLLLRPVGLIPAASRRQEVAR